MGTGADSHPATCLRPSAYAEHSSLSFLFASVVPR